MPRSDFSPRASAADDDATIITRGAAPEDRTILSPRRADPLDDKTQIRSSPSTADDSPRRVAFVPGETVERYQVRERTPVLDNVGRTVIPAPASLARQSRNRVAIETATKRKATNRGIGLIVAIAAITLLAVCVVAGVVAILFPF